MGNLNEKIQQAQTKVKYEKRKKLEKNIEKILIVILIICFVLALIFYIISSVKLNNMINTNELKIGKIFRLICSFLSIAALCLSFKGLVSGEQKFIYIVSLIVFIIIGSISGSTSFKIKSVYYDSEQKVAYYETTKGYEVGRVVDNANVTIYGEVNGKIVNSISTSFDNYVQRITFQGGKWEFEKSDFSGAIALKEIVISGAEVTVKKKTFKNNSYLKDVYINNGTLIANISKGAIGKRADVSIFNNSNVNIHLSNSSLINLADDINSLEISGNSNVEVEIAETAKYELLFNVKKVVINDDANLRESTLKRNIRSYWIGKDRYYSIGNQIYLPSSIDTLPDYFFGDKLVSDDTKIKVYFEGTQEEWDKISIGENGNENYYSGNVVVTVNSK